MYRETNIADGQPKACFYSDRPGTKNINVQHMQLVIFDLDGTLLNTIDDLATCANHILREFGYPEHSKDAYRYFVGNGIAKLIERALPEVDRNPARIAEVMERFKIYYFGNGTELTKPYPGIPELLKELFHRGVVLAVASNKYQEATRKLVRHYFGNELFKIVLGQREGVPVKPNPAIVYEIISLAGTEQKETLYVGDTGIDMQTAKSSGVVSTGVTWGFRSRTELEENGAVYIADRPDEILRIACPDS